MFSSAELLRPEYLLWLLKGSLVTLELAALVIPLATLLGILIALLRDSPLRPLAWPAASFASVLRNSPLLVQLFFWYFGATALLPEALREWLNAEHLLRIDGVGSLPLPGFEFLCGGFGLLLYSSAYISEEIRAGLRGVPVTQRQAAAALGMRPEQIFLHVLTPQALRIALPPLMGQYMNIVKNSSLTMAIGVMELSYAARQVETVSFRTFQAFGVSTLLYILIIAVLEVLAIHAGRRFPVAGARR